MGIIECMVFAARDLRHKSRNTVRTVLCFFVLQFLVILWLLISIVLPRTQAEIRDNAAKKKYLESYIDIDVSGNMVAGSEGYKIRDLLVKKDYIGYDNPIYGNIDMVSYAGMEDRWSLLRRTEHGICDERCRALRMCWICTGSSAYHGLRSSIWTR